MQSRHLLAVSTLVLGGLAGLAALGPAGAQTQSAATGAAERFKVDPVHSTIAFRINHLGVSEFYGRINGPFGEFTFNPDDPGACSFDIKVRTKNIDTNNPNRDGDLKASFFNAKQFPEIAFKSTSVKKAGGSVYKVTGDLTLHGVTKTITVDMEHIGTKDLPRFGHRCGFHTTFSIDRTEFGMDFMAGLLGDEVTLMIGIEGRK